MKRLLIPGTALAAALALAACGGSSSGSGSTAASTSNHTVAIKSVDGVGNVLVDSRGMPLYSSSLDTSGKPACDGACASIWKPLTVASGTPSADESAGKVGVVMRSDGTRQVAIAGRPLYTFVMYLYSRHRTERYRPELALRSGHRVAMPAMRIDPVTGSGGQTIGADLRDVASVRLVGANPGDVLEAEIPRAGADDGG